MDADKMRLDLELASFNIIKHFEALRGENLEVLQITSLKDEAIEFFKEFSFDEVVEIGHFYYYQANCFKKDFTWEDDFKCTIQANLMIVGSGISGDTIVLDLEDYQVGILFHDYFN